MHIGLQIPSFKFPGGTPAIRPTLMNIARTAEDAGFYSMWVMDHFYQIQGLFGETYQDPMMEGYTTLGFLAGVTEKVYLGTMVTGVIYRHPSVLLKTVSTLDIVSGGRAYFGVGAAWYEDEAKGLGIPYPSTRERFERLEETLQMSQQLWGGVESSYEGSHFNAPKMTNNPAPLSQPRPKLLIGGGGPNKTLRMVAQYADACNLFEGYGMAKIMESLEALKTHCENLGRNYDEIEKTTLGTVTLAEGHDTVQGIIERCRHLADLGFTHAIFNMTNVYDIKPLEIFGKEIIPVVKDF
ncbi:MAG: TIGR03560 family F420-dependent LLM class oxidoreductase [Anaerolineae bacterium]|nr:TIGR03560 family F420-dependent LLM class oxidoreductase [Anaerolineae bacterium]